MIDELVTMLGIVVGDLAAGELVVEGLAPKVVVLCGGAENEVRTQECTAVAASLLLILDQ